MTEFDKALTNVCGAFSGDGPTLTVIVPAVALIAVITNGVSCLSRFLFNESVTALTNVCWYCSPVTVLYSVLDPGV